MEMIVSWQERLRRIISDPSHLALALLIGALVGSTIVAFLAFTDWMHALLFGKAMPVWMRPLTPAVAALIAGYLLLRVFPDARGSGIPQTKAALIDRKSTRLNSSHLVISYAVFCLK